MAQGPNAAAVMAGPAENTEHVTGVWVALDECSVAY